MQHLKKQPHTGNAVLNRIADYKIFLIITAFLLIALYIHAQTKPISLSFKNAPIKTVLTEIQQKSGYRILYNDEVVKDELCVSVNAENVSVKSLLETILANTDLTFVLQSDDLIVICPKIIVQSASQITGIVVDENGEPVPFANVVQLSLPDSTFINGVSTSVNGRFSLERKSNEMSLLEITFLGYERFQMEIIENDLKTIYLKPASTQLREITITANSIRTFGSRDNLIIPTDIKSSSPSGLDAISRLPQFNLNIINNILETADKKKIKILLNGLNASETDLMTIPANDILRVEYYTEPPARYANLGVGAVINVITATPESSGMALMINTNNSFTTGYGTNTAYLKFYNPRNQLDVNYFIDYRNLSDNRINQQFNYSVNGNRYKNVYIGNPGTYKGEYHIIQTRYIHEKKNDYIFSSKVNYRLNPGWENYTQKSLLQINDQPQTSGTASKSLKSNYNAISTDMYFAKTMKNNQEIIANAVGTHFKSTSNNLLSRTQSDDSENYTYKNNIVNKSSSLIFEVLYNKRFDTGNFTIGSRYFFKNQFQTYNESTESSLEQQIIYLYSGLSGAMSKLKYNAEFGLEYTNNVHLDIKKTPVNFAVVKPSLSLSYPTSKNSSVRLNTGFRSSVPEMSYLTTNPIYLNYNYYSIGNPTLKPYYNLFNQIQYQLNLPKLYFSASAKYNRLFKPYLIAFTDNGTSIVRSWDVKKNMSYYGSDINVRWAPAKWISLQAYLSVMYSELTDFSNETKSDLSKMGAFSTTFMYRDFRFTSQLGTSYTNLMGDYVEKRMPYYVGNLSWNKNSFSVGLQYIHNPNPTVTYSKSNVMDFREELRWNNFNHLFTVKLTYSFSKGKQNTINQNQRLNNTDNDSGLREETKAK